MQVVGLRKLEGVAFQDGSLGPDLYLGAELERLLAAPRHLYEAGVQCLLKIRVDEKCCSSFSVYQNN